MRQNAQSCLRPQFPCVFSSPVPQYAWFPPILDVYRAKRAEHGNPTEMVQDSPACSENRTAVNVRSRDLRDMFAAASQNRLDNAGPAHANTDDCSDGQTYYEQRQIIKQAFKECSSLPPYLDPALPASSQPPGLLKRIGKAQWIRPCPCGKPAYRHVNRWTVPIRCTGLTCGLQAIPRDQAVWHCLDMQCPYRLCNHCLKNIPTLVGTELQQARQCWVPIPADGFGQLPDHMTHVTSPDPHGPTLRPQPDSFWHTVGSGNTSAIWSSPSLPPGSLLPNSSSPLEQHCAHALALLTQLPRCFPLPVYDYPPGGLQSRFAILFSTVFWHMTLAVDKSQTVSTFYTLLFQHITILTLYNDEHINKDAVQEAEAPSTRAKIAERLKMAETGQWVPLIEQLLTRLQTTKPTTATSSSAKWKSQCTRAVHASLAGSWKLAFRALHTEASPPKTPETFGKVKNTFVLTHLANTTAHDLEELCKQTLKGGSTLSTTGLTNKLVDKRLRSLRSMAQPGACRTKNVHLLSLLKTPWGIQIAKQWALTWIKGKVPTHLVKLWNVGLVTPLGKKSGNGVRPITLFETAFKLATGLALDLNRAVIIKAVGVYQYGALMPSGADRMVYALRALAKASPHLAFVATDIKNAFGNVPRALALKALLKHAPSLARIMANIWMAGSTHILAPYSETEFRSIQATEGVFQGECLSTAVFCIFLREVLDTFLLRCLEAGISNPVQTITLCAYVDDVVLVMDPQLFPTVWPIYVQTLKDFGLMVETTKCKAWNPSETPFEVGVTMLVEQVFNGLPVLGTAADGQFATVLAVTQSRAVEAAIVESTTKRLQAADEDATLLERLIDTQLEVPKRQATWYMLVRSLAVRLDFDMRITPSLYIHPLVTQLEHTLERVAEKVLGIGTLTEDNHQQLKLPGHIAGMHLTSPSLKLRVAHLASVAAAWKPTYEWLHTKGLSPSVAFASIDTGQARSALAELGRRNIFVTTFGHICTRYSSLPLLTFQQPIPIAIKALQGKVTNVLYEQAHDLMWRRAESADKVRLLSCRGTGNGLLFRQPCRRRALHFDDYEFETAARLRLGCPIPGPPPVSKL